LDHDDADNSHHFPSMQSIVAGVAREVRGCLARGEGERVDVLLTLLEALGGEPA